MRSPLLPATVALGLAAGPAPAATLLPDFGEARFDRNQTIDHPYFPLVPGSRAVLRASGWDDEGEPFTERSVLEVLHRKGPHILGLRPMVQRDRAFEDERLVEETFDYFAQDRRGNVWYLGEDVTNYRYDDDGSLIGTDSESAWRAGVHGAQAGWIMPAKLRVGQRYFQEHAPKDDALDQAETFAFLDDLEVDGRTYRDVLQVLEINPIDREQEFKYYARGVGPVRFEEGLDRHLADPDLVFDRDADSAPIPLPAPLALLVAGLAALAGLRARRAT
jgi:hypothetical protein